MDDLTFLKQAVDLLQHQWPKETDVWVSALSQQLYLNDIPQSWIIKTNSQLLGFLRLLPPELAPPILLAQNHSILWIDSLIIEPRVRNQGIASIFLKYLLEEFKEVSNFNYIICAQSTFQNLFENQGFQQTSKMSKEDLKGLNINILDKTFVGETFFKILN